METGVGQRAVFSVLELREAARIRRHGTDDASWHSRPITTLVGRVSLPPAKQLVETVAGVPFSPDDYRYPASDLHVTIADVEAASPRLPVQTLASRLAEALAAEPARRVLVRGLAVSRHTVYAKVVTQPSLGRLRRSARQAVGMSWPLWRPADSVGFVNLVRFRARHDPTVIRAVRELANPDGLVWELDSLELVTTDKVLSGQGTAVVAKVPLRRRP